MDSIIKQVNEGFKKPEGAVVDVRSGDTVRVSQRIKEGNKERIQVFEGLVIRVKNKNSHTASILVRRMSGGVGVEKSYMIHSPLVTKIEITKRGKVRRNYLTYMRDRTGKSARLVSQDFDRKSVNEVRDLEAAKAEEKAKAAKEAEAAAKAEEKAKEEAELKAKQDAVTASHDEAK